MTENTEGPAGIDAVIAVHTDWRGERLALVRRLILDALPDVEESIKWRKPSNPLGVPTWSSDGIVCTGETYRDKIKLSFAHGASVPDPTGIFNASLDAGTRRAVDLHEADTLDEAAFIELVRAAARVNAER